VSKSQTKKQAEQVADDPSLTTPPDQPHPEAALQWPSLGDEANGLQAKPEVEVAERSQDEPDPTATVHRKDFVVLKAAWEGDLSSVDTEEKHRDNIEAARQALMHQGLRPTGDGTFTGSEDHPDGASLILHYEVPAKPAVTASDHEEPTVSHAHVTLDDQRDYEKSLKD
jgi:hypothetical protein